MGSNDSEENCKNVVASNQLSPQTIKTLREFTGQDGDVAIDQSTGKKFEKVGSGAFSNVYAYDKNRVIKVFKGIEEENSLASIVHEFTLSKKINKEKNLFVNHHTLINYNTNLNSNLKQHVREKMIKEHPRKTYMIMERCYFSMDRLIDNDRIDEVTSLKLVK